jgi:m7GpppX diphosphatase
MEIYYDNKKYSFIPNKINLIENIQIKNLIMKNDIFEKYDASINLEGQYIICDDKSQIKIFSKKIIKETYSDYINFINNYDSKKDKWIYNIIDGISEQDNIIFKDNQFLLIPSYTWDKSIDNLHLLSIPFNKSIRCIRDLNSTHIELLKYMKIKSLEIINNNFNLDETELKIFFHYEPSTYHLHIHFINVLYIDSKSSVEYSHSLDNVIFNLELDSDYYKKIFMNKRV